MSIGGFLDTQADRQGKFAADIQNIQSGEE